MKCAKLILALGAMALSSSAMAQDGKDRDVTIENHTGRTIVQLFGSRVNTSDWEGDLLGDGVMADSTHRLIDMYDGSTACLFDFKATFSDGSVKYRARQNVCAVNTITFGPLRHGSSN